MSNDIATTAPDWLDAQALKQALFDTGPDAVLCVGGDGRVLLSNPRASQLFGYTPEEFMGMPVDQILPEPEENQKIKPDQVMMTPRPRALADAFRVFARRKDGTSFPAAINLSPNRVDGGWFTAAVIVDVTKSRAAADRLRESEEHFRRLVELSPDMYFLHWRGIVSFVNQAGVELLGAKSRDEIVGKSVFDFVHPDYHEVVRARIARIEGGEGLNPFIEQKYVRFDGTPVDVEVAALGFEGGEAIQVIARDISARKRAEEMHIRALAAEEEERLKSNLLSTVSHELRTPLTAVRGYASTLLEYYDRLERQEVEDCIRGIDSAAQYLEKIVSDLLTLTRIESGVLHLDRHAMHLGEFLERTLSTHLIASPHLAIGLSVPSKDPMVSIDNVRLQQVVNNLVDNAFKYGGQTKPVSVTVRNRPQPTVIVRDRGPGVPEDALDRIFTPFVRLKGPETAAVSGSGLGLAVCRGIVEAHGGKIWASRPRGGGLQISFTVPKAA